MPDTVLPVRGRSRRRRAAWAVVSVAAVFGALLLMLLWLENRLVFLPDRVEQAWEEPPTADTEDVWLTTADGTRVHAWHLPHADPAAGAVLVSHGNGGNLSHRGVLMAALRKFLGRAVVCYDYPGYGRSDGTPSEAGCYAAGDAAYRWLTDAKKIPVSKVVLYGESLGGGVAVDQASRLDHEGLVLVFTFTSLPEAASSHYPFLPCRTLMANRFDNLAKIGKCHKPVFIAHGTADPVIPFRQGEELFAAANEPKRFLRLEGQGHQIPMTAAFFTAIRDFLADPM